MVPTGFLDLPYELRRQIYCHCIPRRNQVNVQSPSLFLQGAWYMNPNSSRINVLRLSKQITEECLDILYGETNFRLRLNGEGEQAMRDNFTEKNRRRMRYLTVTANPAGVSYGISTPDHSLWSTILPSLKSLLIIAEQPIRAGGYYNAPTLQQDIDEWLAWICPYLKYFGQHIPETLSVTVDDDGRKETRELAQKYLTPTCRLQRSALGDFVFKRGRFSIESGYWDDDYDEPRSSRDV
ncbi:hypothetical protein BJX99DRAFT_264732 [Aspergillus californicus]